MLIEISGEIDSQILNLWGCKISQFIVIMNMGIEYVDIINYWDIEVGNNTTVNEQCMIRVCQKRE